MSKKKIKFRNKPNTNVEAIKQKAGVASLTVNFVKNSNSDCGEVCPGVISYDEDTRKKGNLIILTHIGIFCKNDVILNQIHKCR